MQISSARELRCQTWYQVYFLCSYYNTGDLQVTFPWYWPCCTPAYMSNLTCIHKSLIEFLFHKVISGPFLHHFLARSFAWLLRIKPAYYVSKPLELKAAKDRLFYQSGKLKKWLINSGRSFNFKWRYKWHCAYGLAGGQRHFDIKALPKDLIYIFHSSLLCQEKGGWFSSHNV